MKAWSLVILLLTQIQVSAVGLRVQDILGSYLGKPDCGVRVSLISDSQLLFEIIKDSRVIKKDFLLAYKMESVPTNGEFSFENDAFGPFGEQVRVVEGETWGARLKSLTLKTRYDGLFNNTSEKCKKLSPVW